MKRKKRRGELRDATKELLVKLDGRIFELEGQLEPLKKEREMLKKKLDEEEEVE